MQTKTKDRRPVSDLDRTKKRRPLPESIEEPFFQPSPDCYRFVVKIFCTMVSPSYSMPWQMLRQEDSTSSGFIISDHRILTNAHAVSYQTSINVLAHGSAAKFPAKVLEVSHDSDLALLTVEDASFWKEFGSDCLEFGEIPALQDDVIVVGYPVGGNNISVTAGVVSRIEIQPYSHSSMRLLSIQIDAAINPGNSGGPAFHDSRVIGVAFESLDDAENIGYIIPSPIVLKFLGDREAHGGHRGFGCLGMEYETLENRHFREYLHLPSSMSHGVLIASTVPINGTGRVLKPLDVLLSLNGVEIAHNGTVHFRGMERVSLEYIVSQIAPGEECRMQVLRNGEVVDLTAPMGRDGKVVPTHLYYIFGGFVFTSLSVPFLESEYGAKWSRKAPVHLVESAIYDTKTDPDDEVVVLIQILSHEVNMGYGPEYTNRIVKSVNGVSVKNMKHLYQLIEKSDEEFIRIDLVKHLIILLKVAACRDVSKEILTANNIPTPFYVENLEP